MSSAQPHQPNEPHEIRPSHAHEAPLVCSRFILDSSHYLPHLGLRAERYLDVRSGMTVINCDTRGDGALDGVNYAGIVSRSRTTDRSGSQMAALDVASHCALREADVLNPRLSADWSPVIMAARSWSGAFQEDSISDVALERARFHLRAFAAGTAEEDDWAECWGRLITGEVRGSYLNFVPGGRFESLERDRLCPLEAERQAIYEGLWSGTELEYSRSGMLEEFREMNIDRLTQQWQSFNRYEDLCWVAIGRFESRDILRALADDLLTTMPRELSPLRPLVAPPIGSPLKSYRHVPIAGESPDSRRVAFSWRIPEQLASDGSAIALHRADVARICAFAAATQSERVREMFLSPFHGSFPDEMLAGFAGVFADIDYERGGVVSLRFENLPKEFVPQVPSFAEAFLERFSDARRSRIYGKQFSQFLETERSGFNLPDDLVKIQGIWNSIAWCFASQRSLDDVAPMKRLAFDQRRAGAAGLEGLGDALNLFVLNNPDHLMTVGIPDSGLIEEHARAAAEWRERLRRPYRAGGGFSFFGGNRGSQPPGKGSGQ